MNMRHISAGSRKDAGVEYLIVHGFLSADLTFYPLFSRSAFSVPQLTRRASEGFFVELRDDQGAPVNRRPVAVFEPVVCYNRESSLFIVHGKIALPKRARRLLLFKEDILIDERPIPPPPTISLKWGHKRVQHGKSYTLSMRFSEPAPDAHVLLYYQWGERMFRPIGLFTPKKKVAFSVGDLPGGTKCRLIAAYTSGMRTSAAATGPFSVPLTAPSLRILRPMEKAEFTPWQPVTFEAREIGAWSSEETGRLTWSLNGKQVAKGSLGSLSPLPEGIYTLEAHRQGKQSITARCSFSVKRPKKIKGLAAEDWDVPEAGVRR
jgi:hypothetical protein